jgi:nitrogen regulatory protein PII
VKTLIAIIQPTKLNAVREALEKIEVTRLTVCDGQSFVRREGQLELFGGRQSATVLLRKVVLEIVVNDDFLDRTVETIVHAARTGPTGVPGDGNVFVLPAEQAIQVDDAARGPGAV